MNIRCCLTFVIVFLAFHCVGNAQDPFGESVRKSKWLTPEEQLKTFTVPDGFEMQLFASEFRDGKPGIDKPLNMAFDARGRMWITNTLEYPIAVPVGERGRDSIKILEDTTGDGRADKITTFADGLNIPIGILPIENGCIAFSIPNISKFEDTTGDGKCDKRTVLYGPFGVDRDTHGLNNAFTRGLDGWIYACHGFNNNTTVKGTDGNVVTMQSGNTYRFREDGSRIEHFTHGQVNPFGMVIDERGNFFTSDCHSKPIYQLLQNGYYPSFGKLHDGLGFVPEMTEHTHDSTALDGVCYLDDDRFPPKYRKNFLVGNVMTSRVNRDSVEFHGSTMRAIEQPDLVATTDPWFRPVDIQLGPDGAIYIADFYNKIIGHYEVDLQHPGRDRTSGRIWRLVWKGDSATKNKKSSIANLDEMDLVSALADDNITRRMLAFQEITRWLLRGEYYELLLKNVRDRLKNSRNDHQRALCVWLLERADRLSEDLLEQAIRSDGNLTRLYACQVLSEREELKDDERMLLFELLSDDDPFVRRKAVQAIGRHPQADDLKRFCEATEQFSDDDPMLKHASRISLRNLLLVDGSYQQVDANKTEQNLIERIANISLAVKSEAATDFLIGWLLAKKADELPQSKLREVLKHITENSSSGRGAELVSIIRQRFKDEPELQAELLLSIKDSSNSRDEDADAYLKPWAAELVEQLLEQSQIELSRWRHEPLSGRDFTENLWHYQQRNSSDREEKTWLISSFPAGEKSTGKLHSIDFEIPKSISFFVAGHDGLPTEELMRRNFVRLVDAESGEVLREATAPRNDVAQKIEWKLDEFKSRRGRLEIIDGNNSASYAWLAFGRLEPPVATLPRVALDITTRQVVLLANIVTRCELKEMRQRLSKLLASKKLDWNSANAIAESLAGLHDDSRLKTLAKLVNDSRSSRTTRSAVFDLISMPNVGDATLNEVFEKSVSGLTTQQQLDVAQNLSTDSRGAEYAVELMMKGKLSPNLLRNETLFASVNAAVSSATKTQVKQLRSDLPDVDAKKIAELKTLVQSFKDSKPDPKHGLEVFTKQCASCHQVGGKGSIVGPQLDGIGGRGIERIVEDVFLPNRNVDIAFRTTVINDLNGKVHTGLFRRKEAGRLFFVDSKGKEFSVAEEDVDDRYETKLSLMPENWLETLPRQDALDLLKFLTTESSAK